jgi:hypothetical protein
MGKIPGGHAKIDEFRGYRKSVLAIVENLN